MYQIALCDDSPIILEQLQCMIKSFPEGPDLQIWPFLKGAELERALRSGQRYDLIILDMKLEEMSGVDIAKFLRKELLEPYTPVLYISAYNHYPKEIFDTQPLNFLEKPIQAETLHECILKAISTYAASHDFFDCMMDKVHQRIPCCIIQYFESQNKKIFIHTTGGTLSCYGKLAEIKDQLPKGFIMIHKSYLVNANFVTRYDNNSVLFFSGLVLPVSRNFRAGVYRAFQERAIPEGSGVR